MAWRVSVDRATGSDRVEVSEIRFGSLPSVGSEVVTEIKGEIVKGIVTSVSTSPCKSPGMAVEVVNHVFAQEVVAC